MAFFSSGPSYTKLKTNLRLCVNRLKLLEKKKTEIALKSRKEIADYISAGKEDRGRIRVEHIIREDYLVEAMELVEMYCDLLIARFGIIQTMKEVDPGLEEAIATLIWVTPRLQSDVPEFKIVSTQLTSKYGKVFAEACAGDTLRNVSEKVKNKLDVRAPPAMLVERYMIEIAKAYNVPFEPDPSVFRESVASIDENLLDFGDDPNTRGPNDFGGNSGGGGGFGGGGGGGFGGKSCESDQFPNLPSIPGSGSGGMPYPPSSGYPSAPCDGSNISGGFMMPPNNPGVFGGQPPFMMPPGQPGHSAPPAGFMDAPNSLPPPYEPRQPETKSNPPPGQNPNYSAPPAADPPMAPMPGMQPPGASAGIASSLGLPDLPDVPLSPGHSAAPSGDSGPSDFDDLSKRFEELKKRK